MTRTVLALITLAAVLSTASAQPPRRPDQPRTDAPTPPTGQPQQFLPPDRGPTVPQQIPPAGPQAPEDKSLDQLLDELEAVRAQKAELEKREQEVTRAIQRRAEKQAERMNRLGVTPGTLPAPTVPAQPAPYGPPPVNQQVNPPGVSYPAGSIPPLSAETGQR